MESVEPAPTAPPPDAPAPRRRPWDAVLLLLGALALQLLWIAAEPSPTHFEDEPHYNQYAHEDVVLGTTSLLPGELRFDQRPELISRLWANLLAPEDPRTLTREHVRLSTHLVERARWVNLVLFLGVLLLVHLQARVLGLSRLAALLAPGLLALFPWFAFYVHTLWAEVLHAFLTGALLLALLTHLCRPSRRTLGGLGVGGLALGVALLTKGTLNPFLPPLFLGLFAVDALRARRAGRALGPSLAQGLAAPAVLALGALLVVGPQLRANAAGGHGYRFAGNRWKNIEMGVLLEPRELQTDAERDARARLHDVYMLGGETYEEREARSEERLTAHIRDVGWGATVGGQVRKLGLLLFRTPSFFERALAERWGSPPPAWLALLRWPGRVLWTVLLVLGGAAVLLRARRSPADLLLAGFVLYYAVAVLAIPYKVRFLAQLFPVLALLTAALVGDLLARRRTARAS